MQLSYHRDMRREELDRYLRIALDCFDVWGIVATDEARRTEPVRNALAGTDVPLLVMTDSTTLANPGAHPNEIRLQPSNAAQARKLLYAAVLSQREGYFGATNPMRRVADVSYVQDDRAGLYAADLVAQLKRESELLGVRCHDGHGNDPDGPLIVVGYDPFAEKIRATRSPKRVTIFSDGFTDTAAAVLLKARPADAAYWFMARPAFSRETVGEKLFAAVDGAIRDAVELTRASTVTHTSRRDQIKDFLSALDSEMFRFEGIENVAPGYEIMNILAALDAATAEEDKDAARQ
jgi:hypothetical protein